MTPKAAAALALAKASGRNRYVIRCLEQVGTASLPAES